MCSVLSDQCENAIAAGGVLVDELVSFVRDRRTEAHLANACDGLWSAS
jgi:hypothetical protein